LQEERTHGALLLKHDEFNSNHGVMPGLVRSRSKNGVASLACGIRVLAAFAASKHVDGRDKPGHGET
jgi:hypothetical protein